MSSYFLCSHCLNWVRPHGGHCPECSAGIDIDEPDPPLDQLRDEIGDITVRLGAIKIPRKSLPGNGMLYATTRGLFFVPHRVEHVTRYEERPSSPPLIWRVLALFSWPLHIALLLFRGREVREVMVAEQRPHLVREHESDLLPEMLMDNPGAFFLPLNSIRTIERRRDRWLIDRLYGGRITILSENDHKQFDQEMCLHLESPGWKHVVMRC